MKNLNIIYMLILAVLFCGCSDDKEEIINGAKPEIEFALEKMDIDLNEASHIPVVAFIKSQIGLESVQIYFTTDNGDVEYKTITSFFNKKTVSISENPAYNAKYKKLVIKATDMSKQVSADSINLVITDIVNPPSITFSSESIIFDEATSQEMPVTKFTVDAPGGIKSIELWLNTTTGSMLLDGVEPENEIFTYTYEQLIQYVAGNTGLKVQVYDKYDQVSIETLPVIYIEVPRPIIDLEQNTIIADKDEVHLFKASLEAELGIKKVILSRNEGATKTVIKEIDYPAYPSQLDFEENVTCTEATSGLTIEVFDKNDRSTESTVKCFVHMDFATDIQIRSQFSIPTATSYPDANPALSLNDLKTYSVDYAIENSDNASNIDIIFFCYSSQALNQIWNLSGNSTKLTAKNAAGKTLAGMAVKNSTLFMVLPESFDFDNATNVSMAQDINAANVKATNLSTNIIPGSMFAFKTASTSKAGGDRIGIARVEDRIQIGSNQIDTYLVLSIKFPKK